MGSCTVVYTNSASLIFCHILLQPVTVSTSQSDNAVELQFHVDKVVYIHAGSLNYCITVCSIPILILSYMPLPTLPLFNFSFDVNPIIIHIPNINSVFWELRSIGILFICIYASFYCIYYSWTLILELIRKSFDNK